MTPCIKICGVRRPADAALAVALGASHVGIVLAADSPRRASRSEAREVLAAVASAATTVLVVRGGTAEAVAQACIGLRADCVQWHGGTAAGEAWLAGRGLRVLRVRQVAAGATALPHLRPVPTATAPAVFDGGPGGAGAAFDWSLLLPAAPPFVFVAGGVRPGNVTALLRCRPWGIDVSSGVESAPGEKDPAALRTLFAVVALPAVPS